MKELRISAWSPDCAASTACVAQAFLDFYAGRGYTPLPGSSLLDASIPSTFVMSAGLVQVEQALRQQRLRGDERLVLLQTCFRHFDLNEVGASDWHLSLFRMAGAFAFGRLSRQHSLRQAWELLTQVYCLPAERLWVTCFAGGLVDGVRFAADRATRRAWLEIGVPPERLAALGPQHNFWRQSARMLGTQHAAKCGPNSEVFYDRGAHYACGPDCRPGCRCGRFIEIMNNLFIRWQLDEKQQAAPLEQPFTETVIGVERLAALLQAVPSVYELEDIRPLMLVVDKFAVAAGLEAPERQSNARRLVDHWRALLFLVADGAPPPWKKGEQSYIMRRLVRGMITSQRLLKIEHPAFYPALLARGLALYEEAYPHLQEAAGLLSEYIETESTRFGDTLARAEQHLQSMLSRSNRQVSGAQMVELEKRHGMPLPLLKRTLQERQARFSLAEYQAALAHWRQINTQRE